jgi:STE24 endopeptidase
MFITVGAIFFIYILTKVYISVMEIGFVSKAKHDRPVILIPSNYVKAAEYKIASERMGILGTLFEYLLFIFWIGFGLKWLDSMIVIDDIALKSVVFILAFGAIGMIVSLPFDLYKTFVLDKKFGFSNMDAKLYIIDTLKSMAMSIIFGGAVIWLISQIIINIESWWIWGFALIFTIVLIIRD